MAPKRVERDNIMLPNAKTSTAPTLTERKNQRENRLNLTKTVALAALVILSSLKTTSASEVKPKLYTLYHDLVGDGSFTERGSVMLSVEAKEEETPHPYASTPTKKVQETATSSVSGANDAEAGGYSLSATVHAGVNGPDEKEGEGGSDGSCIDPKAMDALVSSQQMYRIKARDEHGNEALASVPACSLRRANFREQLFLMLGPNAELLSLSYTPIVSPLAPPCSSLKPLASPDPESDDDADAPMNPPELKFRSKVYVEGSQPSMPVPLVIPQSRPLPGLTFFPTARGPMGAATEGGKDGNDPNDPRKNQSFLLKYWYIIVPLCLVTLFGGGEEPPPPAGSASAGAGAGGGGNAAGGAGGGGAGGGGGGARQRRGKRG